MDNMSYLPPFIDIISNQSLHSSSRGVERWCQSPAGQHAQPIASQLSMTLRKINQLINKLTGKMNIYNLYYLMRNDWVVTLIYNDIWLNDRHTSKKCHNLHSKNDFTTLKYKTLHSKWLECPKYKIQVQLCKTFATGN